MNKEKSLRILFLNWRDLAHPASGGAEVYTHAVAEEWVRQGHTVTIFSAAVEGYPLVDDSGEVRVVRAGGRHTVYRAAKKWFRHCGRGQFDLIVDGINTRGFNAPRWSYGVPVVGLGHQVCRELWFYQMPWPIALAGRFVLEPWWLRPYRRATVVTVSESSRVSFEHYGLQNVTVTPMGGFPVSPQDGIQKEENFTVIFIGRLVAHKRPNEAIEAFRLFRQDHPTAQMWVAGRGEMAASLAATAPAGVTFMGRVSELEKFELLQRAHVIAVTSVREGWGLIVTEAAALGTPGIGYDVPGVRDSIRETGGTLVSPTPEALAQGLREFYATTQLTGLPEPASSGVVAWGDVANAILAVARRDFPRLRASSLTTEDDWITPREGDN